MGARFVFERISYRKWQVMLVTPEATSEHTFASYTKAFNYMRRVISLTKAGNKFTISLIIPRDKEEKKEK